MRGRIPLRQMNLCAVALTALAGWTCLPGCGEKGAGPKVTKAPSPKVAKGPSPMEVNVRRWTEELERFGQGDWAQWEQALTPFQQAVRKKLDGTPKNVHAIIGTDGFLFFRKSTEYLISHQIRGQPNGRDPFPTIVDYAKVLRTKGVDLLFCPIPVKGALFPDKLVEGAPPKCGPYVNPHLRRFMLELGKSGVECLDLMPSFLEARDNGTEPLYQKLDTHWTHRTLRLCAALMAARVRAYPWFKELTGDPVEYKVKTASFTRNGDIAKMLRARDRRRFRPMKMQAEQVLKPDGSFYEDDESSPILMLGDSYAGVFHFEDCEHAGVSAHLAKELRRPVDLVLGQGMGPKVWGKLRRGRGAGALKGKRLVIWLMSARDLVGYRDPWKVVPF